MKHIQANAAEAVREMLVEFSRECHLPEVGTVRAEDAMDDGTPIQVNDDDDDDDDDDDYLYMCVCVFYICNIYSRSHSHPRSLTP